MLVSVSDCDSPTVYCIKIAFLDPNIVVSCNSCCCFICWLFHDKVDTAICHVLVINVTCYIMDVKIVQYDMIYCSVIFCNSGNSGSVHCISIIISLIFFCICCTVSVICQFQTFDLNVLCIHDQNTGRYCTMPFVV